MKSNDAAEVMGWPDNLKLKSSLTLLFALASIQNVKYSRRYWKVLPGRTDQKTVEIYERILSRLINMHGFYSTYLRC